MSVLKLLLYRYQTQFSFLLQFFLDIKWRKCDLQKCLGASQETLAEVENYSARPQNKGPDTCVSQTKDIGFMGKCFSIFKYFLTKEHSRLDSCRAQRVHMDMTWEWSPRWGPLLVIESHFWYWYYKNSRAAPHSWEKYLSLKFALGFRSKKVSEITKFKIDFKVKKKSNKFCSSAYVETIQ